MEKRIRLIRGANTTSFIHEMVGDKIINSVNLLNRNEAIELWNDLSTRYGFVCEMHDKFPKDLFREVKI